MRFVITVVSTRNEKDSLVGIRKLLKRVWRQYGLRCVSVVPDDEPTNDSSKR